MKVGIYFTAEENDGGVFQYSITLLEAFSKINNVDFYIFSTSKDMPARFRKLKNFHFINLYSKSREKSFKLRNFISYIFAFLFPKFFKITYKIGLFQVFGIISRFINRNLIKAIEQKKLDLVFYPTTSNLSFLIKVPAVVTIHDLHHKLTPWFKEVSAGGRMEMREYTYSNICKNSWKLLAESKEGKEDLIKFYKVDENKVVVLPMLPPSYLVSKIDETKIKRFLEKKNIKREYVFYPAKFWPHKNHLRLLKAISLLKKKNILLDLVLSGSNKADFSTYGEVIKLAEKLGIKSQIKYLGYVTNEELSTLYKGSLALVMPTFFGATNLPVLEAWKVGTAVIYSDIRGCRNQLGDAGLLVNIMNYRDISDKIEKIYRDRKLRQKLIQKGVKRLGQWTEKDFIITIISLIKDYSKNNQNEK